jgi:hypothetical protein
MKKRQHWDYEITAPLRHACHRRPVTRRQFLSQGFMTGSAFVAMPTFLSLLTRAKAAQAQQVDCSLGGASMGMPFIGFDLAGGANIAGSNVMVGLQDQLTPLSPEGYLKLGLPEELTPQRLGVAAYNEEFGIRFHRDSAMLRGMLRFTSPAARANTNGVIICARSANDTGNNPHNPIYGINRAGASGALLELVGTEPTDSGGRSTIPMTTFDPSKRPTKIDRPQDARGLVDTGELVNMLGDAGAAEVMNAMEQISKDKLAVMAEAQSTSDVVRCAYEQSRQLVVDFGDPASVDPLLDPDIVPVNPADPMAPVPILPDTDTLNNTSEFRKTASVMKLVVEGKAGAGTIEFGGYDYHDSTRATGERKDERAGEAIGMAIEYAHRRNQDLMIYVFSDGSVASNGQVDNSAQGGGKGIWKGDNSSTAASLILVYGRDGRPPLRNGNHQIGVFRDSGSVETGAAAGPATQISNSPESLAEAIVLNYLALHGREGEHPMAMNGSPGLSGNLDALMGFVNIRAPGV